MCDAIARQGDGRHARRHLTLGTLCMNVRWTAPDALVVRCVTSLVVARGALVRSRSIVYNKALGTKRCYSSMNTGITRFTNITVCHGSVVYSRVMPMKRETIVLSGVLSRNTPTLTRQRPPLALLLCHRPPSRCPCAHVSGLVVCVRGAVLPPSRSHRCSSSEKQDTSARAKRSSDLRSQGKTPSCIQETQQQLLESVLSGGRE